MHPWTLHHGNNNNNSTGGEQLKWAGEQQSVVSSEVSIFMVYTVPTRVTCQSEPLGSKGWSQKLSLPIASSPCRRSHFERGGDHGGMEGLPVQEDAGGDKATTRSGLLYRRVHSHGVARGNDGREGAVGVALLRHGGPSHPSGEEGGAT